MLAPQSRCKHGTQKSLLFNATKTPCDHGGVWNEGSRLEYPRPDRVRGMEVPQEDTGWVSRPSVAESRFVAEAYSMRVTFPRRSASCSRSRLVWLKGWLVGAILLHMACGECAAWYRAGHWGVAYLAWRGLDGTERRVELVELLRRHPHAESFLRADRPEGVDPDEWMFVQAANWPDWVAAPTGPGISEAEGAGIRRTYYRPAGHFVNLPIVHPDDKRPTSGTWGTRC